MHYTGVNFGRDIAVRNRRHSQRVEGDPTPGGTALSIARGIEVGHIFQLGYKYS